MREKKFFPCCFHSLLLFRMYIIYLFIKLARRHQRVDNGKYQKKRICMFVSTVQYIHIFIHKVRIIYVNMLNGIRITEETA